MKERTRAALRRGTTWAVLLLAISAGPAHAAGSPRIAGIECLRACAEGAELRGGSLALIRGRNLSTVFRAIFPGGQGGVRSVRGRTGSVASSSLRVRLPWETVSGKFILGTRTGLVSRPARIRVAPVPVVSRWRCLAGCAARGGIRGGSLVQMRGVRLGGVASATLLGRRGARDDRRARVSHQSFSSLRLRVPTGAVSGGFVVTEGDGTTSPRRKLAVLPSAIFPVRGPHDFGSSGAHFGAGRGGRSHQGQDVFARCGTPLVAARGGRVQFAGHQSSAGNYIVIDGSAPDWDYVYMHLVSRPTLAKGTRVAAGQQIGQVGDTGNAHGCHLHFELWRAPGWYEGGRPFDPLPALRAWDRAS